MPALLAVLLPRALRVSVGEALFEGVGVPLLELQALLLLHCVPVALALLEPVVQLVGVALLVVLPPSPMPAAAVALGAREIVALPLEACVGVAEEEAQGVAGGEGVGERVAEGEGVNVSPDTLILGVDVTLPPLPPCPQGEPVALPQAQGVAEAVRHSVGLAVEVEDTVSVFTPVVEALALALGVALPPLSVAVGLREAEGVPAPLGVGEPVPQQVGEGVALPLPRCCPRDTVACAVKEEETLGEREAVRVMVGLEETLGHAL